MKHGSVVLADRHAPMLEGVGSLLEGLFEVVVMVSEENSLFKVVEWIHPEVAVIDVSFPVATSNAVGLVQERYPNLKIIALSSHRGPAAVGRILSTGAAAFVLKCSAATDLVPAVGEVLAGRTYVSPDARRSTREGNCETRGTPSTSEPDRFA